MLKRCPRCGESGIFTRWVSLTETCPQCALRFERVEGYWLGSVAINLAVTEGLFVAALVLGIVTTWPDVPWGVLLVALVTLNLVLPILFHPYSRTLWIAVERHVHRWDNPS